MSIRELRCPEARCPRRSRWYGRSRRYRAGIWSSL